MSVRSVLLAVACGLALSTGARAQRVTFSGHGDPEVDRRIQEILGDSLTLLAHDTTVRASDTLRGPVLAAGITLRLEGTVVGELVGVASDLFIHPRAVVTGEVVNGGGGLYPSSLAKLGGTMDRPLAQYEVTHTDGGVAIRGRTPSRSPIVLDGLQGVLPPSYDRVDGLWLRAGAALRLPAPGAVDSAFLHATAGWRSAAGPAVSHTVDLLLRRGRYVALFGQQRQTRTPDRWIRGDLTNALSFLMIGRDYRDYYDSQRFFAAIARDWDGGSWGGHVALGGNRENDRSMPAHDPFVIFRPDTIRPNPAIDEGVISSLTLSGAAGWSGYTSSLVFGGELEAAGHAAGGNRGFGRYEAWAAASLQAFRDHTLAVRVDLHGPLPGTDSLPLQRWSHVGGGATLPTFPVDAFRGDRVVFVSTEYVIPFPAAAALPVVGVPSFALLHAAGMGWTFGQSPRLEQNLGAELRSYGLALRVITNPAHARHDLRFNAGFSLNVGRAPKPRPYFDTRAAER